MKKTTSQGSRVVQESNNNFNLHYFAQDSNQELKCERFPIILSFASAFSSQYSRVLMEAVILECP